MKIFYDHQIFSLQDAGGASRYFYELVHHLPRNKVCIDLLQGLHNSVYPFQGVAGVGVRVSGTRTFLAPGVVRYVANDIFSNAIALWRGRFDIYHSTLYRALPLVSRRRLVATHHDCIHEIYPQLFRNAKAVIENKRRLYASADAIICVSESSRRDLLRFYPIDERRTHVIYHGFSAFQADAIDDGRVPGTPYVLYVGARGTYKNFVALLEAFAKSGVASTFELLAVGGGGFTPLELDKIESLGLKKKVRVIPLASEEVLAQAYRRATILVYPSLYEGFGFPPLEAMSLGCPVLTANSSSMPEVCDNAAFYFDADDPTSLTTMLQRLLSSPQDLIAVRKRGYDQVSLYRWEDTAAKTFTTYRQVLGE